MENTTPFDLEAAIQKWRAELAQSPAFKQENLDELESHLRDSIARWQTGGLLEEEAFLIAARRVGQRGALETEFGKMNGGAVWMHRLLWMLLGLVVWHTVSMLVVGSGMALANTIAQRLQWKNWQVPAICFSLVHLFFIAASAGICWYLVVRRGQQFAQWFRKALEVGGRALVGVCVVCLLPFAVTSLNWVIIAAQFLRGNIQLQNQSKVSVSYGISNLFVMWAQYGLFLVAIFILARRITGIRRSRA